MTRKDYEIIARTFRAYTDADKAGEAAQDWLKIEASGYRADCHQWAAEQ